MSNATKVELNGHFISIAPTAYLFQVTLPAWSHPLYSYSNSPYLEQSLATQL
jgi:hypothetical protein